MFQCIIDNGALPRLLSLLTHNHKKSMKKEACWTISNITAGNNGQIQVSVLGLAIFLSCNEFKLLETNLLYIWSKLKSFLEQIHVYGPTLYLIGGSKLLE